MAANQVTCESCQSIIPAEDVDIHTLVARCRRCDAVFDCREQIQDGGGVRRPRKELALPAGLTFEEGIDGITIRRRWRSSGTWFLVLFTLFWDGFLVFWYFIALTQNGPLMMKIFPVLHVAIGAFITYLTLANLLNTTTIRATYDALSVVHAPVKWPGSRVIDAADVKQLAVKQSSVSKNDRSLWSVMLDTASGKRLTLVGGLEDRDHAEYIEGAVEQFLELEDRPER